MASENPQQPDGFSFQPGQLIPTAPYIFPGEEELCYVLEFAAAFGSYIPVIGWIVALVAEIIEAILDLIDELVALFTGKPRAQDTLTVAGRLARGKNPAATIMSVQIHRNLSQNNIVLSSSTAADQKILGAIRRQGEAMLVAQGATSARAAQVVDNVWSNTTSNTQALPAELNQSLAQGLTLVGTVAQQALYVQTYNKAIQNGADPEKAAKEATNALLQQSKMGDLGKMTIQTTPPPITQPPPPTPQPPQPPTPPVPPTPPGAPQPCYPAGNQGQGDELTDGLACVAQNLSVLAYYVPALLEALTGPGSTADPVTCTQLTAQVALITAQLADIAIALAPGGSSTPTPVDLTAVVTSLAAIASSIGAIPGAAEDSATLVASATASNPPVNLAPLVDAINNLFQTIDVPPSVVQQLVASGYLTPDAT